MMIIKKITQSIRRSLLDLAHVTEPEYTAVLMQGSGTFGVESVFTSVVGKDETLLIAANGAYGERMAQIAEHAGVSYILYREEYHKVPSAKKIGQILKEHPDITHVAMVHSETTSGILNLSLIHISTSYLKRFSALFASGTTALLDEVLLSLIHI